MNKPTNQDPVEWAVFNNWVAEGNARRAFIQALADSKALDALDELEPVEFEPEVKP